MFRPDLRSFSRYIHLKMWKPKDGKKLQVDLETGQLNRFIPVLEYIEFTNSLAIVLPFTSHSGQIFNDVCILVVECLK